MAGSWKRFGGGSDTCKSLMSLVLKSTPLNISGEGGISFSTGLPSVPNDLTLSRNLKLILGAKLKGSIKKKKKNTIFFFFFIKH